MLLNLFPCYDSRVLYLEGTAILSFFLSALALVIVAYRNKENKNLRVTALALFGACLILGAISQQLPWQEWAISIEFSRNLKDAIAKMRSSGQLQPVGDVGPMADLPSGFQHLSKDGKITIKGTTDCPEVYFYTSRYSGPQASGFSAVVYSPKSAPKSLSQFAVIPLSNEWYWVSAAFANNLQ